MFGNDPRKKGGIAIYVRQNLKIIEVQRSKELEVISVKILLPGGHCILAMGVYHPPKPKYSPQDLIDYITDESDKYLASHPNDVILCGGDLNRLDLAKLADISGLEILVDFPTRGNSKLDNCLTNKPELFAKPFPITSLIKTDHRGFILPAGTKLKPFRQKIEIRDCREHRKVELHKHLLQFDWSQLSTKNNNIDDMVNDLQSNIIDMMNKCLPIKKVNMSSRDPYWMTPLVKSLLRKRARICRKQQRSKDSVPQLNLRITELINQNKQNSNSGKIGSGQWWKKIDRLSGRREEESVSMVDDFANQLNDYFANLCFDSKYVKPTKTSTDGWSVPFFNFQQVYNSLTKIKRTASGPDLIPFWVWRDHADIFSPIVCLIWNLSLASGIWPLAWKQANVKPLPKVDTPSTFSDYRGINITPIIARTFEKEVYRIYVKKSVEAHLNIDQFAYRSGGSCTNALIKMQHTILKSLDCRDTKAVRLFSMDFSKAFDNVKHDILCDKLKRWPDLNPNIINWYISFLENRKQRVVINGHSCEWKEVNKGTVQGSVSGPYLFNIFLNDLNMDDYTNTSLSKYAAVTVLLNQLNTSCSGA